MTLGISRSALCLAAATLPLTAIASAGDVITLPWKESGVTALTGGMRPKALILAETKPDGIKRLPEDLKSPRYATLTIGAPESPTVFQIILDEADGKPSRLLVDANANGDLTDDPVATFTSRPAADPDGGDATSYDTSATITIPFKSRPRRGVVTFYQTRAESEKFDDNFKKSLTCYADYGVAGEVNIGGKTYPAALQDSGLRGDFRPTGNSITDIPIFWLGIPGASTAKAGKSFLASKPFEVDGKWWALADVTAEGTFRIVESAKPADADKQPARPPVASLTGQKAPAFTAPLLGGGEVKFPDDYKGKIVLVDFWATWCGPCVAELPNVIAAYEKYHDQGLEVLGISLDKEGAEQKLTDFIQKKKMPWKQVYEGKFWGSSPVPLYKVNAIPRMMLIDGDTGTVINDDRPHGGSLAPAIEKALAAKNKKTD